MSHWKTVTPEQKRAMIDAGVYPSFVALRAELRARGVKDAAKKALRRYCPGFAAELASEANEIESAGDGGDAVPPGAVDGKDGPSCASGGALSARLIARFTAAVEGKQATPDKWVTWIARNLEGKVEIKDCPDVGALNYLIECRRNPATRAEFWRLFMQKSVRMESGLEDEGKVDSAVAGAVAICMKARERALAAFGKVQDGLQGGETASRLAHTQETVGSTPTPVTTSGKRAA